MPKILLSHANRYRDLLKEYSGFKGKKQHRKNDVHMVNLSRTIRAYGSNREEFNRELDEKLQKARVQFERAKCLEDDFYLLRREIILANRNCGIEDLLFEIDECKRKLDIAEYYLSSIEEAYDRDRLLRELPTLREEQKDGWAGGNTVCISLFTEAQLQEEIDELTKKIEVLRKEINHKNATHSIEVELSPASMQKLGL